MKKIETDIIINASEKTVWNILTDFQLFSAWNPFIKKIEGNLEKGQTLKTTLILNGKENHFTPTVTSLEEGKHFEWLGTLPLNMFNGRHYFKLEKIDAHKTRLIHGETFTGWAHSLILLLVGKNTKLGFEAMNGALKKRAENLDS